MTIDPNDPMQPYASPNPYSWESQMPQYSQPKQSGLGIASFVLAFLAGGTIIGLIVLAGVMEAQNPGGIRGNQGLAMMIGFGVLGMGAVSFLGLGLGIAGLFQPNRSRLMAILGLLFNFLVVAGIAGLMLIGMAAQR